MHNEGRTTTMLLLGYLVWFRGTCMHISTTVSVRATAACTLSAMVATESWLRIQDHTAVSLLVTSSRPWPKDASRKADQAVGVAAS